MAGGNAWPFFLFQLDQPEVGSESEPEKSYRSSRMIGILLSCICKTASSCWSAMSLASSSVIFELACANFLSAFQWWSHSVEALFSASLTSSVRLSWQLLYHSTFLSDSEDASSSIWQTMFGHVIQKAFSNLPGWYFYHRRLWCFYNVRGICFAHITSLMMCCGDKLGHPMDVPAFGLESSFEYSCRSL